MCIGFIGSRPEIDQQKGKYDYVLKPFNFDPTTGLYSVTDII